MKTPGIPPTLVLKPNYPNPFSSNTSIRFDLPRASDVTVTIYDVLGHRFVTITEPDLEAGENTLVWDGRDRHGRQIPSGVYFYRLEADGQAEVKRMTLIR